MNDHDHNNDGRHLATETAPEKDGLKPEAVSLLAHEQDPSLAGETTDAAGTAAEGKARAGVSWVRPTDLLAAKSAGWAGRGIDFQAGLAERVRAGLGRGAKATGRGTAVQAGRSRREPSSCHRCRRSVDAAAHGR
jgi:hypothetical protein